MTLSKQFTSLCTCTNDVNASLVRLVRVQLVRVSDNLDYSDSYSYSYQCEPSLSLQLFGNSMILMSCWSCLRKSLLDSDGSPTIIQLCLLLLLN